MSNTPWKTTRRYIFFLSVPSLISIRSAGCINSFSLSPKKFAPRANWGVGSNTRNTVVKCAFGCCNQSSSANGHFPLPRVHTLREIYSLKFSLSLPLKSWRNFALPTGLEVTNEAVLTVEDNLDRLGDGDGLVVVVADAGDVGAVVLPPEPPELHGVAALDALHLHEGVVHHLTAVKPVHAAVGPTWGDKKNLC